MLFALGWSVLTDQDMGPFQAVNPHDISEFIFTALLISYVASLLNGLLDLRYGIVFTGVLGGFASSTATIHHLGEMNRVNPGLLHFASIGALLSNVATLVQMLVLTHLLEPQLFDVLTRPVIFGIAMLFLCALLIHVWGHHDGLKASSGVQFPFNWRSILYLAMLLLVVTVITTGLSESFGASGLLISALLSGVADAHSIIAGVANMLKTHHVDLEDAKFAVLLAFSSNCAFKVVLAWKSGGRDFAKRIAFAIALCNLGVWLGAFWG